MPLTPFVRASAPPQQVGGGKRARPPPAVLNQTPKKPKRVDETPLVVQSGQRAVRRQRCHSGDTAGWAETVRLPSFE